MGSALYGRLGTVSYTYPTSGTATTSGTLALHDTLAVQGSAVPYVIFQLQASLDEYTFGTVSGESADYLVKSVSNRQTALQGQVIYNTTHANLQDATLTIVGSYPLRVRRRSRVQFRDGDGYWHVGGIYRIDRWNT